MRRVNQCMRYKGYDGTVEYSEQDKCLFGKVIGIQSLILYEGTSVKELEADFHAAVDDYLKDCSERKIQPEIPFKGNFNIRISPDLHRKIAILAREENVSLNTLVEKAIKTFVVAK